MKCKCGGTYRVNHTYGTSSGKTQALGCDCCPSTATAVVILAVVDPDQGQGAYALAKQIDQGSVKVALTKEKTTLCP